MPLDILITDFHENIEKSIPLRISDYDLIRRKISDLKNFPLLEKCLSNYYGDYEIYLNQVPDLKKEVLTFRNLFKPSFSESLKDFISGFLDLIEYAIENRRTIKFIGD